MFDQRSAILASIAAAIVGWAIFMGLPIRVGAFVDFRSFTEEQVGYLASADLGTGRLPRFGGPWRHVCLIDHCRNECCEDGPSFWVTAGISVAIVADIFSIYSDDFWSMMGIRLLAGTGTGFCCSIALANLAATTETARNFSLLVFAFVFVNFLELYSLEVISDLWGVSGIFGTFISINLICLLAWPFLPRGKVATNNALGRSEVEMAVRTGTPAIEVHGQQHAYNLVLLGSLCLATIACF